jgi:hypothetical protein
MLRLISIAFNGLNDVNGLKATSGERIGGIKYL